MYTVRRMFLLVSRMELYILSPADDDMPFLEYKTILKCVAEASSAQRIVSFSDPFR